MKITVDQINQVFASFKKMKALVIGDVMIDAYVMGRVDRISPEAPVPIVRVKNIENRLGGAANVALNLASLDITPILAGVVGDDVAGKTLAQLLKKHKLNTSGIIAFKTRPTTVKTRVMGNNGQMLRIDEETEEPLKKAERKKFIDTILSLIETEKPNVVIFEDYDKGIIDETLIEQVVKTCAKKKIPVAVDPKKQNFLSYKNVTLFKPNLKELREGLHTDSTLAEEKDLFDAVKKLEKKLGNTLSLVTLSERGVLIGTKGKHKIIPAHYRTIVDVSGAGDTVIAVAAACLAAGAEPQLIAELANMAGGLVCEKPGVVPINKNELLAEAQKLLALK